MKTDRMPFVTYAGRDDFYRGRVAHMVSLAHLDGERAAIVDNNRPGIWLWMTRAEFLSRWRDFDGGWAGVLLDPPPPPHPAGTQAFGQCPGGACPVPNVFVSPAPVTLPPALPQSANGPTPPGWCPGPDFVWHNMPGVGWGWVQKSLVPAPAVGAADEYLTGVVSEKVHAAPAFAINGVEVSKDEAMAAVGGSGLVDDSDKWHVTAVGDAAFLAKFKADVAALPESVRSRILVQAYAPDAWAVPAYKLPPGVSIRKPSAARTSAEAAVIGLDVYDAVELLRILNELLGLVKPAPQPQPQPPPLPAPGPQPVPSPEPAPQPVPDQTGLAALIAAVIALLVSLFRKPKEGAK
jgi:hypothetical protein